MTELKDNGPENATPSRRKKRKSETTYTIAKIILIIIMIFSIWKIVEYIIDGFLNRETNSSVESIAIAEYGIDFDALLAENPDTKAWITIPGTEVNNVVVQRDEEPTSSTDFYYLDRDFYGNYSQYGTLFFDPSCTIESNNYSQNLIIYGHNMKNGQMFGILSEYEDESFYQEHQTITLTTPDGEFTYNVFAVIEAYVVPTAEEPEPFYYIQSDFSSQEEFMAYVEEVKSRSLYDIPVEVSEGDEILTLSTCDDYNDDKRFVVFAVKEQEQEQEQVTP